MEAFCRHPPSPDIGEREAVELLVGDPARMVEVSQLADQHEVLAAGKGLVDRCELAGEADRLADVGGLRGDVEPVHHGAAVVSLEQRGEDLHDGCLAGSVGAEHSEDAAPRNVEIDAAQHLEIADARISATSPSSSSSCSERSLPTAR
jgi:hypothetical protein